jgi:hypothetical protein
MSTVSSYQIPGPVAGTWQLIESAFTRSSEAEHVTVVVYYFESAQAILGVCERLVHGNGSTNVLFVERVGVGGVDVGVPARPFVAGMIGLGMNLRSNRFEAHHDAVTSDERPEILAAPIASALVLNFKAELGLIEVEARLKIIDNKAWNDTVESRHGLMVACADSLALLRGCDLYHPQQ